MTAKPERSMSANVPEHEIGTTRTASHKHLQSLSLSILTLKVRFKEILNIDKCLHKCLHKYNYSLLKTEVLHSSLIR
jgi:hypothetical protein